MLNIIEILRLATERNGSDIFLVPGSQVSMKISGAVEPLMEGVLMPDDTVQLLSQVYALDQDRSMDQLRTHGDDDFSFSVRGVGRFRCNAYMQRSSMAAVLRVVSFDLPRAEDFHIPEAVVALSRMQKGLVLVTGPAGSGKSTTLACIIDRINEDFQDHVITIEDPIEFIHKHKRSIVSQREIAQDTDNYQTALRAALRQAPDVILVGEMRDFETIQTAVTAAETGQLILSTLHTVGAAKTIDRIIDVFPANQQQQIRIQLSMVLRAVVSQQLIPAIGGGREPAFEIMLVNSAIQNMIRDGKVHQMDNVIYAGAEQGMRTMDGDLLRLCTEGRITLANALLYASNADILAKKI